MKPPCKECPDRKAGCHGKCQKYLTYRAYQDARLAEQAEQARQISDYAETHKKLFKRRHKRRGELSVEK